MSRLKIKGRDGIKSHKINKVLSKRGQTANRKNRKLFSTGHNDFGFDG